jgi:hypothetical protein
MTPSLPDNETRMLKIEWVGTDVQCWTALIKRWIIKTGTGNEHTVGQVQVLEQSAVSYQVWYSSTIEKWIMVVWPFEICCDKTCMSCGIQEIY